ncbi:esterase-like activity of phytase family protein [Azospirillum sp. RWY-5-1]|uniref:Esterase-like activity of phytase family protein n=1 Tax=Azospirillum oleiclasticum TaxID=2735135 RepID=A0ABX2TK29_9PROT|nr:esterase-like activity of phytase family protein [Azospirillum oleiclasticum]NYZ17354.1 esterase-like activity of phytase family protein [Azospirillum oleiclasticum]NYZ24704.1 esterase-like activity of phytase family protein [Azospirillum oleiclasticum]
MIRSAVLAGVALVALAAASAAHAQTAFPATLAGHALLPAKTFIEAPADAPADLKVSGKFTTGTRVEAVGSVEGKSGGRPTGVSLPFQGQPVQGHSGIQRMADGSFWLLTDNGFGSKANSPDSMLFLNHYTVDFAAGTMKRLATIFLHDPDKKVPFRIVHEGTEKRYLTGSDFDTEGFQIIGDTLWIGDEFGPFIIKADLTGKVLAVYETMVDGKPVRSPDHPAVLTPAAPGGTVAFEARRSKGYEGLASSKDGKFLYGLLEGPVWNAEKKDVEKTADGKEYLRIVEFDVAKGAWTGRSWQYVLETNGNAIGDFNMIDGTTGMIIERDNLEGTADKACAAGAPTTNCFAKPAEFKRVYKIELTDANAGGPVRKIGYIDLMKIADPDKKSRKPLTNGVLTFPFFTIENVDVVDATHIVVGNDNNLPFSSSREPNAADDNELVLLEVGDFLKAK